MSDSNHKRIFHSLPYDFSKWEKRMMETFADAIGMVKSGIVMTPCTQCGTFTNEGQVCVECTNHNTLQSSNT